MRFRTNHGIIKLFDKTKGKLIAGMELSVPAQLNGQKRLPELVVAEGETKKFLLRL